MKAQISGMIAGIALGCGSFFLSAAGMAETAKDLQGAWTLISATVTNQAEKRDIFGSHPSGTMSFEPSGRFAQVIIASGLPKFASKSREKGSDDENKAVVQGSIAYFGSYAVRNDGIVDLQIEASTFPNMTGTKQQRSIRISGDELTWGNATPAVGAGVAEQRWKRAK